MFSEELKNNLKEISKDDPCESVIAITGDDSLIPLTNISLTPEIKFKVSRREINSIGEIKCLFHTHISDEQPGHLSFDDIKGSKESGIPFLLWHKLFDEWDYYDPNHIHPYPLKPVSYWVTSPEYYTGWLYDWWRCDCYTIVRSYYRGVLDLELKDFERRPDEKVLEPSWNRFQENFKNRGFIKVRDLQLHDLILFNIYGNANGHHIGVYIGDNEFLHILKPKTVSKIDNIEHFKNNIVGVWRKC